MPSSEVVKPVCPSDQWFLTRAERTQVSSRLGCVFPCTPFLWTQWLCEYKNTSNSSAVTEKKVYVV